MPVLLITFTAWRRLELIAENILPVHVILCDVVPKASVNDLESCINGKFPLNSSTEGSSVSFDMRVQM